MIRSRAIRYSQHRSHNAAVLRLQPNLLSLMIASLISGALASPGVSAAPATPDVAAMTFDVGMFAGRSRADVDYSRFNQGNVILPGTYRLDIMVNENRMARRDVRFSAVDGQDSASVCFSRSMLAELGVDPDKVARGTPGADTADGTPIPDGQLCGDLGTWIPGASAVYDAGEQRLALSVPQIFMNLSARGYVDPKEWDSGIDAGLLAYNFSSSTATRGDGGRQGYLGLVGGFNLGDWRFRHQGAQGWSSLQGRSSYQNTASYMQRSIAAWKSQLTIGDSFSSGSILDSVRLRGVSLASDDRMLPQSQQGYAPVVRGIAEGNATVSITQNGYKIYETTVAPGPFMIDDLYPTGYGGDLTVTVTEAGGRRNTYVVPYAAVPELLRADTTKYALAVGQLQQYSTAASQPTVLQATLQHGLSNSLSLYGGTTLSSGYTQTKLGTAFATPIGAISLDATHSSTRLPGQGTLQGQSFGMAYNKNIPETGTNFALGAYRFSTRNYLTLNDAMNLRDRTGVDQTNGQLARQKSRLDLNIHQKVGDGTLTLFGSSVDYYASNLGRQTSLTVGYGSRWKDLNWNLSLQRSRIQSEPLSLEQERQQQSDNIFFGPGYNSDRIDNRLMLTLSMPLGRTSNAPHMTTSYSRSTGDTQGSNLNTGISGSLGQQHNITYGASASHSNADGRASSNYNLNGGYRGSKATLRTGYSQYGDSSQLSFGADGGIVLHGGGVTLAQNLGDTVGLVHAPDAEGAGITNASGVTLDGNGYGVVPYLTPFQNNSVGIDPKGTSHNVELLETTQSVAPTLGAVSLLHYETVSGRAVVFKARQPDGQSLPFAAQVFDEAGQAIGVVGQGSKAFVRGVADSGILLVKWGEAADSQCRITYALAPPARDLRHSEVVEGQCLPQIQ